MTTNAGESVGQQGPSLLVGLQNGAATLEGFGGFLQKETSSYSTILWSHSLVFFPGS